MRGPAELTMCLDTLVTHATSQQIVILNKEQIICQDAVVVYWTEIAPPRSRVGQTGRLVWSSAVEIDPSGVNPKASNLSGRH